MATSPRYAPPVPGIPSGSPVLSNGQIQPATQVAYGSGGGAPKAPSTTFGQAGAPPTGAPSALGARAPQATASPLPAPPAPAAPVGGQSPQYAMTGATPYSAPLPVIPQYDQGVYQHQPYVPSLQARQAGGSELALLQQLLDNPTTLTPQAVAQLREQQKEYALGLQSQAADRLGQSAAARGTYGGGTFQGQQQALEDETRSQILGAYRDIDLAKIAQDRADQLAALQAAESVLGGLTSRDLGVYSANQQGQQSAVDSILRNRQLAIQQALGLGGLDLENKRVGLEDQRIGESARQFNLGHELNWANTLNNMLMGRYSLGLDYAQLQALIQSGLGSLLLGG